MSYADPLVGRVFAGRFELLERLDQGGMGAVYRARQLSVGREVALKVLHPALAHRSDIVERFKREARTLCQVEHPSIVTLYDFGEAETGELFLVMELLQGETLGALLDREGPLEVGRALALTRLLAEALDAAHRRHIVHRDLKPDNLWLPRVMGGAERLKVLDFGLARSVDAHTTLTGPGVIFGTPAYMAPEVIAGRSVGPAADLYAVGCILYLMLAGRPPFGASSNDPSTERPSIETLFAAHLFNPPPPLPDSIPAPLHELVRRLLDKAPEHRLGSAADLLVALDAVRENIDPRHGRTAPDVAHPPPPPSRRWFVPTLLAVTALIGGGLALAFGHGPGAAEVVSAVSAVSAAEPEPESAPDTLGKTGEPLTDTRDSSVAPTPDSLDPSVAPTSDLPGAPAAPDAQGPDITPSIAPTPATITLTLESTPPAVVTLEGKSLGTAPGVFEVPMASTAQTLRFSRAGHTSVVRKFIPDRDQVVRVRLPRAESEEWMSPPPGGTTP